MKVLAQIPKLTPTQKLFRGLREIFTNDNVIVSIIAEREVILFWNDIEFARVRAYPDRVEVKISDHSISLVCGAFGWISFQLQEVNPFFLQLSKLMEIVYIIEEVHTMKAYWKLIIEDDKTISLSLEDTLSFSWVPVPGHWETDFGKWKSPVEMADITRLLQLYFTSSF